MLVNEVTRIKPFIMQKMDNSIIRRYNYNYYKYLKLLQHVSEHKGSIFSELYTVFG